MELAQFANIHSQNSSKAFAGIVALMILTPIISS
jgi:hypothetical protein